MTKWLKRFHESLLSNTVPQNADSESVSFVSAETKTDTEIATGGSGNSEALIVSGFVSPVLRSLYRFTEKQIIKNSNLYWLRQCYVPRNRYRIMLQELKYLNRLWLKGELLEAQGHFEVKSARYQERMGELLRKITQRASEIYELLQQEKPALLRGEYYLMPDDYIEKVIAERNELVKEKE